MDQQHTATKKKVISERMKQTCVENNHDSLVHDETTYKLYQKHYE